MSSAGQECNRETFRAALADVSSARRLVIAYSGGLDSHALLHLLADLRDKQSLDVSAVHVDHGLQRQSARWAAHCEAVCAALNVPLRVLTADARASAGESPEAAARRARYAACVAALQGEEELVTAHTSDDQAETLLLRLLRGTGVDGAVAIRARRALGEHWVIRPLLGFSRAALSAYARDAGLRWIEDPSNRDLRYDRNFVRLQVLPLLAQRWPAAAAVLARDAANFAAGAASLESLAREDLAAAGGGDSLAVDTLRDLAPPRRDMVLRLWLREAAAVTPSSAQLQQLTDMLSARRDSQPCVHIGAVDVRRYRNLLTLVADVVDPPPEPVRWSMEKPLRLPHCDAPLTRETLTGLGLCIPAGAVVEVRFRGGGERLRLAGHTHSKSLKQLFQERGVPPWRRGAVPLFYIDGELAAVPGIGVAAAFSVAPEVCENEGKDGG